MKIKSAHAMLHADKWHRSSLHDGYVTGNGKIYLVGGLGWRLTSGMFAIMTQHPTSLTALAWIVGPVYGHANLGSDWQVVPAVNGTPLAWTSEKLVSPTETLPAWGVSCRTKGLAMELTDLVIPDQPVILRRLILTRTAGAEPAEITLGVSVAPDVNNGGKDKGSIPDDQLISVDQNNKCLLLRGAKRRLYEDRYSLDFETVYYHRFLATGFSTNKKGVRTTLDERGMTLALGKMTGSESVEIGVWLVTAFSEKEAKQTLARYQKASLSIVTKNAAQPEKFRVARTDHGNHGLLTSINNSLALCRSSQSACGGVLASPYTFPVNYVRDQQGSFRLFMAAGDYARAYQALLFHVAMQNRFGIQNAFDAIDEQPRPDGFDPKVANKDGSWKDAEVPSYIILFARDYYRATGELEKIRPFYARLAYNLRVQCGALSKKNLLPSPGDESFTQLVGIIHPKEFTDSNLLFIGAADFMAELAGLLGKNNEAKEFKELGKLVKDAVMKYLWLPGENRFACSTVDQRPILDALLRCFWWETEDPNGVVAQGCLQAVLKTLVNPIRVVSERSVCAGMDPGYLLYAMSRCQHPQVHEAARLVLQYASRNGTYSEYYSHQNVETDEPFSIQRMHGTLRPWESGTCATALLQYLMGLRLDAPAKKVYLQPHLPHDWPGWVAKDIQILGEGTLTLKLSRRGKQIVFELSRTGGKNNLTMDVEFGVFGTELSGNKPELQRASQRKDLLAYVLEFPAQRAKGQTLTLTAKPGV